MYQPDPLLFERMRLVNQTHSHPLARVCNAGALLIDAIQWTVAGKVKAVTRTTGSTRQPLEFAYGASGQRISKQVGGTVGDPGTYREHYIRDAQGNIMATYRLHANGAFRLQERPIYGSARVGLYAAKVDLYPAGQIVPMPQVIPVFDGLLRYELNDHLGNVGTVVTGRLLVGQGAQHEAEVISAQGYEPGGSLLPGRNYSSSTYNYGFNGMPKDDEVHGATGTSYDFGARLLDPRVGRWLTIDPKASKYPSMTPYCSMGNSPLLFVDRDGEDIEIYLVDASGNRTTTPVLVIVTEKITEQLSFPIPTMMSASDLSAIIGSPERFDLDESQRRSEVATSDASMIDIDLGFAFVGGMGATLQIVNINKGNDQGTYLYKGINANIGFDLGASIKAGPIDFNEENSRNVPLDRYAFAGTSTAWNFGAFFAVSYVRATTTGSYTMGGESDRLYDGVLLGATNGVSATWNASKVSLWKSYPEAPEAPAPSENAGECSDESCP